MKSVSVTDRFAPPGLVSVGYKCIGGCESVSVTVYIFTDACNTGAGLVARHDWAYIDWVLDCPLMTKEHINVKETMAIIYAVCVANALFYVMKALGIIFPI